MADDDPFAPRTGIGRTVGVIHRSVAEYSLPAPPAPTTSGATATTEGPRPQPPDAPRASGSPPAADQFFGTPIKNAINPHTYEPITGKQRGPFLVGKGGMGPRFCQFTVDAFLARLPPPKPPTAEQREIFKGADLSKVKLEKDIYPLLTESIDSVFKAATAKNVRVLETPSHRAHDGHGTRTDTLNDAGIYLKNEAAVTATTLDAKRRVASKIDKLAERHHIGVRSWHWLAIPIEVKHGTTPTAFEFRESPDASPEPDPATQKTQKRQKKQKQSAQASSAADASEQSTASDPSSSQGAAKTFIRSSAGGEAALAQFIEYMLNVFDNQHRVFSYALYVWDHLARLCYFDRDGAVVSEEFKWTTPDSPLHDFLWRVATMSEAELGYDETAKRVKDDDDKVKRFKAMHNDPAVHEVVTCKSRLGLKPGALARLQTAGACSNLRPGPQDG